MNYKIVPNFLPKKVHDFYINNIPSIEFFYNDRVGSSKDNSSFYFVNRIYWDTDKIIDGKYFKFLSPLLYHSNINNLQRAQVNCFIKQSKSIITGLHVDQDKPHKVLLYSVNTNNGYTILDPQGENIKVPSVANQALFFDGSIPHQAVTQTDSNIRLNINLNYT